MSGAIGILILGESGTGKSASIRNLDPKTTGIINVNSKRLPFKNAGKFKTVNTDDPKTIMKVLSSCIADTIIIDDYQYLIANEFMQKAEIKGYDKFTKMAVNYWSIIKYLDKMPDNKTVYFMSHLDRDQFGNEHVKTIGKLLDEKITIEGLFTIVLKTVVRNRQYYFSTQNSGQDTVKTPLAMFEDELIPNDLAVVDRAVRDYYGLK